MVGLGLNSPKMTAYDFIDFIKYDYNKDTI